MILENMAMAGLRMIYTNRNTNSAVIDAQKTVLRDGDRTE